MMTTSEHDYKLSPSGRLGGSISVEVNKCLSYFRTMEEALEFVQRDMDSKQHWPCMWWTDVNGHTWMIDEKGNEVTRFDE